MDYNSQKFACKMQYLSIMNMADILFSRVLSYYSIAEVPLAIVILIVHSGTSHVYLLH